MPILSARDLSHAFGAAELFEDVVLSIEARDRIGLVGPNGSGKTTLLLALAGLLEPTGGTIDRQTGVSLGYLRQEAVLTFAGRDNTIYEEMLSVFARLREQEQALQAMETALAAGEHTPEFLSAYGQLQDEFDHGGGYQYRNDIKHVLMGLGFPQESWDSPLLHLSGGQKTRVLLGRLLLEKPDLLILDEPTNHLDMDAVEWLEGMLRRWEGALLIVSHDRYFLDRVVNRIWDLDRTPGAASHLTAYKGNYSAFISRREEARERALRLYEEERERLEAEADFIQKHLAGGQTDIAKGRLRQLTRDLSLIEEFGIVKMAELRRGNQSWMEVGARARTLSIGEAIEQIKALRPPVSRPQRLNIRFDTGDASEKSVWRAKDVVIGYPGRPLFRIDEAKLIRGSRVAVLGPNGSGKSTLLRTILGEIDPQAGEAELGGGVVVGYFAQAHEQLDPARRVIDELLARRDMLLSEARSYLAGYNFRGDDVFKRVSELSGGERGRLAMALLAAVGANLLLLDEPTNHLDIPSQEALQEVLEAYDGTILLVSHDRYLVDRLATEIWSIEDGSLRQHKDNYQGYLRQREGAAAAKVATTGAKETAAPTEAAVAEVVSLLTDDNWFGRGRADEDTQVSAGPRPRDARRRRELEEAILDAEDWLARVSEALEEIEAEGDELRAADLRAEIFAAEDEIAQLHEQLTALDRR